MQRNTKYIANYEHSQIFSIFNGVQISSSELLQQEAGPNLSNLSRPSVLKIYRGVKSRVDLSNNLKVPVDKDIYKPKIPSFSFFNLNNSVALSCKKHE